MSHCWPATPSSSQPTVDSPWTAVRSPVTFISGEPYCRRAELVDGGERRPGVGRLVAERAVELGGVPDRLVDGEEQVGRVDDEVVAAGLHRGRLRLLAQQLGDLGQLAAPVPVAAGQVLPALADRRGQRAHALELAGGPVDGQRGELRVDAHALLAGARAGGVGVVLLLLHVHAAALHVLDAVGGHQLLGQLDEQRALLAVGHPERVDLVVGDPHRVGVDRLRGQLDAVAVDGGGDLGDGDGLLGQPHGLGGGEDDARGEAPGALVHHADGETEVLAVGERLRPGVAQADRLRVDALDPDVGVLAAEVDRPGERGVGQRRQREGEERLVDGAGGCHAPLSTSRGEQIVRIATDVPSEEIRRLVPIGVHDEGECAALVEGQLRARISSSRS